MQQIESILVEPVGGLCNRLRVVISSIILAESMGRQVALIWTPDTSCYCEFYDLFRKTPLIQVVPWWRRKLARAVQRRLGTAIPRLTLPLSWQQNGAGLLVSQERLGRLNYKIDVSDCKEYPFIFFEKCFSDFMPAHISPEEYADRVSHYLNHLEPIGTVVEKVFELPSVTVGVHIRRGDNKKASETSKEDRFIERMREHLGNRPGSRFFLATDDPSVEGRMKDIFRGKIISFSKSSYDRKDRMGIQEALVELLLLSKTDEIIGSYWSSFSECAALFRRIKLYVAGVGPWEGPGYAILRRSRS